MKLYLLSQEINNDYDTYDSMVVCAENEEDAKNIHPSEYVTHYRDNLWYGTYTGGGEYENDNDSFKTWVGRDELDKIIVKYLGDADKSIERGVVCASFNAG